MLARVPPLVRLAALVGVIVLLLVVLLGGCGDDADDKADSAGAKPESAEVQARNVAVTLYGALKPASAAKRSAETKRCDAACRAEIEKADAETYCDQMTVTGQLQVQRYGEQIAGPANVSSCEDGLLMILRRTVEVSGDLTTLTGAEVTAVVVRGERATVSVESKGNTTKLPLVMDGGEWRFPATVGGGGGSTAPEKDGSTATEK